MIIPASGRESETGTIATNVNLFKDLKEFVKTAVERHPDLLPDWIAVKDRHGRKFAIDRWLED